MLELFQKELNEKSSRSQNDFKPGLFVFTMAGFFIFSCARQADIFCPVVEIQFKKIRIQRLNLAMNPRKPDTNSTCAVCFFCLFVLNFLRFYF